MLTEKQRHYLREFRIAVRRWETSASWDDPAVAEQVMQRAQLAFLRSMISEEQWAAVDAEPYPGGIS